LVPVTNGSIPGAPDGGHNSHAGTLLAAALGLTVYSGVGYLWKNRALIAPA